jgi:hypothetical protein
MLDNPSRFSLFDLLAGFTSNAECGYRTGLETLDSDLFAAFLADTILAGVKSPERLLNLEDQFTLAIADTQNRVSARFHRRSIGGIRKILIFIHVFNGLAGFRAELLEPLVQEFTKKVYFLLGHGSLAGSVFS